MSLTSPTLHMLCGKIAAGKSTLASRLAGLDGTVLIAEDDWLNALFAEEMSSPSDYVRCASKLRKVMGPHITTLLNAGVSVVLDFPANTVENRDWMRGILEATNASHQLHLLVSSDELCLARLRERNAQGDHPFAVTEAQFRRFSEHFVAPSPDEGFNIVVHDEQG
ncbi:AAA family ATPase [Thalassovita aquimarina]|uniref:ATP-binding protein n=1 Tax=Thalassovita aquimarina TaxID=2785917 RepID=A0ABS5HSB6_9RHOB|nr:ATP-binding protein [Thalassovita aquimarina]MBR9651874.1 ATP-binding protein [Thalassovita aquimarina]